MNFYSNSDLVQYLGTSDSAIPEIKESELGARKDSIAYENIELDSWNTFGGDQELKKTVLAPFVYIMEGAGNALNWMFNEGAGHSEHLDSHTQKQIIEKTTEAFEGKNP